MDGILKDARFAHIPRDPAFKRIPKQERKVKIDKRFQSMFSDKKFKVRYSVDKRGRPMQNTSTENLRRYYDLDSSNESEDTSSDEKKTEGESLNKLVKSIDHKNESTKEDIDGRADLKITERKVGKQKKKGNVETDSKKISSYKLNSSSNVHLETSDGEEEDSDSDFDGKGNDKLDSNYQSLDEKLRSRLQDMTVDYARGEGVILSDSSSDEESSDEEEDDEETIGWGQLDEDAERTDESTNRLAVCNMDWDRITAKDLMVLLHSFVPKGGLIHSVTIYPSEFGLQRLKEEEEKGPLELRTGDAGVTDSDPDEVENEQKKRVYRDDDEVEEGNEYQREKLRQYQLKRLRYFYAVVVCDSVSTADALYKECDGMEYESSASHLDLRFIPDDVTFDQEPKETCTELPNMAKYEPQLFITTALQQSKVRLTWDETDPRRNKINEKINTGKVEEIDDNDLKAYLATSSEEESSEEEEEKNESASKYRALLETIESQEVAKKEKNMEMEVTWGFDLSEKVKKRMKDGKMEEMTPFQKYLERRKEKRRAKREEQLKKKQQRKEQQNESGDESVKGSVSEDDIPSDIDMNDAYFKEEFEKEEFAQKGESKKKKNKKKKDDCESEDEESKRKKAELELLLMDEEDNKKHFSLKDILIEDSEKKKKKNKKQLEEKSAEKKDDFQINVHDKRFSALFTSHLYNIDPADPHYKKTKGMEALRQEKLNRRSLDEELPRKKQKLEAPEKKKDPELSSLVKNVKRKTQTLRK